MKHSRLPLAILMLPVAALLGCRGSGIEPSSPGAAATGGAVTIAATASEVRVVTGSVTGQQSVFDRSAGCTPMVAPVGVLVGSTRPVPVRVREIRTRVVADPTRIQQPQLTVPSPVTFPAPLLIEEFGTNLVQARSQRIFLLRVGVGCQFLGGRVELEVDAEDDRGQRHFGRVTVAAR